MEDLKYAAQREQYYLPSSILPAQSYYSLKELQGIDEVSQRYIETYEMGNIGTPHTDVELGHLGQKIVKLSGVYFLKVQPYTFPKRDKIKYFYYVRLKYEQKHIFQYYLKIHKYLSNLFFSSNLLSFKGGIKRYIFTVKIIPET